MSGKFQQLPLIALFGLATGVANAQAWPTKAVRIVVPFAAGGPADALARFIAVKMSAELGQPVVIDNKDAWRRAAVRIALAAGRAGGESLRL